MKKSMYLTLGACLVSVVALCSNANTADLTTGANGLVTIDASNVAGAPDLTFNPSSNVIMDGESSATAFQENAYHTSVLNKASGQAYGMSSSSNKVWFLDISTTSSYGAPSGTTAAAFTGATPPWTSI